MKDAKPAKTPMGTDEHLNLSAGGKFVDQKAYRSIIGSFLYLCFQFAYVLDFIPIPRNVTMWLSSVFLDI
jgi:hypothetical protein